MRLLLIITALLIGYLPIQSTTKRALLVGISDYPDNKAIKEAEWPDIHRANDIQIISKTLKQQGFKINTLSNDKATASQIRKALARLVAEVDAGDMIYLHFSCHGQPVEDLNGDEQDGWADVCMLEACRAYQSNYDIKQDGSYYGPLSYYVNQVLQQQSLTKDTKWVETVKQLMDRNPKLVKQNMVIQTTLRK